MKNKFSFAKKDLIAWTLILLLFLYHHGIVPESFIIQFIIYITGTGPLFAYDRWYSKYYNPSGDPIYNILSMMLVMLGPAIFWSWIVYRLKPIVKKLREIFEFE